MTLTSDNTVTRMFITSSSQLSGLNNRFFIFSSGKTTDSVGRIFLVSLEIYGHKDLPAMLPTITTMSLARPSYLHIILVVP